MGDGRRVAGGEGWFRGNGVDRDGEWVEDRLMAGAGVVNGDGWWAGCMEGRVGPWRDHGGGTRLSAWEHTTEWVVVWDEGGGLAGLLVGWRVGAVLVVEQMSE